jgi:hypothetical protein
MSTHSTELLSTYRGFPEAEMLARATAFADELARRRTVRTFADRTKKPLADFVSFR